jgi:23S rRNA (cytosine1962-C5)-methyltransferase
VISAVERRRAGDQGELDLRSGRAHNDAVMDSRCRVKLKPGREKAALNHHPWVFSGAVASIEGAPQPGEVGDLLLPSGEFLARGFVNPASQIVFRAVSYNKQPIDAALLLRRLEQAAELRSHFVAADTTQAFRLVNSEGDRLPGLVVDRYGDWLAIQVGSAGMERLKGTLVDLLQELFRPRGIYERSRTPTREEEGLSASEGVLAGEAPPDRIGVLEQGLELVVDLQRGQKTGLYLDQRPARLCVRRLAEGRRVLDLFSYSGGFSLNALKGGAASVVAVDRQGSALKLLLAGVEANRLEAERVETVRSDAFDYLRHVDDRFDLMLLDPPPFAKRKSEVQGACRGYKELHREGLRRLNPGGLLITASCSHHMDPWLFQQLVFQASREMGRTLRLLGRWGHAPDHPVLLDHPQGEYLKVLLLAVV